VEREIVTRKGFVFSHSKLDILALSFASPLEFGYGS
jgi:hypothetical protein